MALLDTLQDKFHSASLDTGLWAEVEAGSVTVDYSTSDAQVTFPASSTSSTLGQVYSITTYDLTSSSAYIHVKTVPSSSTNAIAEFQVKLDPPTGNSSVRWYYEAGTLTAQRRVGGVNTTVYSVAYSSTTHAWWRIREASGTVYWDTSTNGYTWTNRASYAHSYTLTGAELEITGYCYQAETSPGTFNFEYVSTLPTDRYWVGGTDSWDSSVGTKWATTSGGTGGAPVPTSADTVYFDASSGSGTTTISATATTLDLITTGYTGTIAGTSSLDIYGSMTLGSGMTFSHTGTKTFKSTSTGKTITTNGVSLAGGVTFNGTGGAWSLLSNLTTSGNATFTRGSFDANDFDFTAYKFIGSAGTFTTLSMGSGTWTLTGSNAWWDWSSTGPTINAETSTLVFADTSTTEKNIRAAAGSLYDVVISGGVVYDIFDHSMHDLTITGVSNATVYKLYAGRTFTIDGTLTVNSGSGNLVKIKSDTTGNYATLLHNGDSNVVLDYLHLQDTLVSYTNAIGTPTSTTYSWTTLTGGATSHTLGDDAGTSAISLPFTFTFFGAARNSFYISSNGYISFNNNDLTDTSPDAAPDQTTPDGYIAGVWTDLDPTAGGTIKHEVFGTTPNRYVVVEFDTIQEFSAGGDTSFQIKLFESDNHIEVHTRHFSNNSGGRATQAVENPTGKAAVALSARNNRVFTATSTSAYSFDTSTVTIPTSSWYAGANSTDYSNNSGWLFTAGPVERYWVGDSGNWSGTVDYNYDSGVSNPLNATITRYSQSFYNEFSGDITSISVGLSKTGTPTGNLTAYLYLHSGSYGTTSTPGSLLATSDTLDVSTLTTSEAWKTIMFSGAEQYTMSAATNYVLVLEYTGGDASNYVNVFIDSTGTHGGNAATYTGSWSANASNDMKFEVISSTSNHWSTTSGGATGASAPDVNDSTNVKFDANSFTTTGQTVVLDTSTGSCLDFDWTGVTNSPTFDFNNKGLEVYGQTIKFANSMSVTNVDNCTLYLYNQNNGTTFTLTSGGHTLPALEVYALGSSCTFELGDDLTCYYFSGHNWTNGAINTNNYDITVNDSGIYGGGDFFLSATHMVDLGTSTITAYGDIDLDYAGSNVNNLTASAATFILADTTAQRYFYANQYQTVGTVTALGDARFDPTGLTIDTLTLTAGKTYAFYPSATNTINISTAFNAVGTDGNYITLTSSSAWYISKASGTIDAYYLELDHSNATGGATWNAHTSFDGGNNTGWNFVDPLVDITLTSSYSIGTDYDITKPVDYVVGDVSDITKTATYKVLSTVNITKTAQYAVPTDSTITKNADYIVSANADITKPAAYTVAFIEQLDSISLRTLKIGKKYGPVNSVVLGRVPQNDNIVIASTSSEDNTISSIDTGTDLITIVANGMADGSLIRIDSTGTYPDPIVADTNYYVFTNGDPDTFALAETYSDAVAGINLIDITSAGSGTITLSHIETQEVQINNNQIVDDDRTTLLPDLYAQLVGIEWNEVEATTVGLSWFEVGDVIKFDQGSEVVNGFISEIHLTFDGSIKETLKSVIPDVATIDYQTAGGVIKTVYNTEIKVDKQENDITSIVEEQTTFEGTTADNLTEIYQNISNILLTIQQSGGGNLILNSVGFATESALDNSNVSYDKFSFWDYNASYDIATNGAVSSYSSSESQNAGGVSGQATEMAGADITLTQRVNVAANTAVCFAVRVNKAIGDGDATITLSNDNDFYQITIDNATAYNWEELTIEDFEFTLPWVDIVIEAGGLTKMQFTDLRMLYGNTLQGWVQAAVEILSTNVQFTKNGMKIFDSVHDTETQVTYNEFSTRRRADDVVLFEADDSGVVTNDLSVKGSTNYLNNGTTIIRQITIPSGSSLEGIAFIRVS